MSILDDNDLAGTAEDLAGTLASVQRRADALALSAGGFAGAMTRAFAQAATGGKQFDEVLKLLALRLSNLAVREAFRPLTRGFAGGLDSIFSGGFGGQSAAHALGAIKPFAAGGVIGAPTYFPLAHGGLGLAGEAGPEAIMPLARGRDGRLGVATAGAAAANVTVNIATPDADSFRRSEAYVTGQIARAVARGQRGL
jgi:phage-related minor tail protein